MAATGRGYRGSPRFQSARASEQARLPTRVAAPGLNPPGYHQCYRAATSGSGEHIAKNAYKKVAASEQPGHFGVLPC